MSEKDQSSAEHCRIINTFRQPKSFYLIFFIELWERFGYYGLQSVLTVYLVKMLDLSEMDSISLFSSFSALAYGFVAIGGWLGDKIIGTKRTIFLGIIVLTIGYGIVTCSVYKKFLIYLGMATISIGSGLFKANPSSLLSNCYKKNDPRLDGAFTMYYMAINIGSFLSMLITPLLVVYYGWGIAFSISIIGMLIALANFIVYYNSIRNYGSEPDFSSLNLFHLLTVIMSILILIPIATWLLYHQNVTHITLWLVTACVFFIFFYETFRLSGTDRYRMIVTFIMMLEAVVFFVLYGQMPTSLNFFTIHNVKTSILGINFEPEQFQALNPLCIMIMSPLLAIGYSQFDRISIPFKFSIGMILCSLSFLVLPFGANFADENGLISIYWLISSYILQSIGELMISGLGLAMVAQMVPRHLMGFMMGVWFLTTATAAIISGFVANLSAVEPDKINNLQYSLQIYSHVFMQIGIYSGIIAIFMLIISPKLSKSFKKS